MHQEKSEPKSRSTSGHPDRNIHVRSAESVMPPQIPAAMAISGVRAYRSELSARAALAATFVTRLARGAVIVSLVAIALSLVAVRFAISIGSIAVGMVAIATIAAVV